MRQHERDALLERQVDLARRQLMQQGELTDLLGAEERRLRARQRGAAFPAPRRLFGGERGAVVLLKGIPGFAGLWERTVPAAYIREVHDRERQRWQVVNCPCGEHPALRPGALADCACGRWYFTTGDSVRVRRFETDDVAAAA